MRHQASPLTVGAVLGGLAAAGQLLGQAPDTSRARQLPNLTVEAVHRRSGPPPVPTIVVDSTALRVTQAADPWDLVRRTAGVEVHEQGQGPGFAADAVIRGFTSDHSSDLLLVIDGIPINLPLHGHVEGYSDWNVIFPAAASELRVIHGPASPLYGDFALGGVVELTTAAARAGTSGAITGSSFGDLSGWLLTGRRGPSGGWVVGGRLERNDGWRDRSGYLLGNGIVRWSGTVGQGRLEGGALFYRAGWDSPGFLTVADYNARRLRQAGDPTDGGEATRLVVHARYTTLLGHHVGLSALGWAQGVGNRVYLNIPEGDDALEQTDERDRRAALGGEAQLTWHLPRGDVNLGASGRWDDVSYRLLGTVARHVEDTLTLADGIFRSAGAFGRWRLLFGSILFDLGLRADALHYQAADGLAGTPSIGATQGVVSPKLGARYLVNGNLAVLGSVSRGFRGSPGVIGDPARPPLTAWAKELGVEYLWADSRVRLGLFRFDVRGERIQDPVTREISGAGRSVRQGVDGDIEIGLGKRLRVSASATFNDAVVSDRLSSPSAALAFATAADLGIPIRPSFHLRPLEPGDPIPGVSRYLGRIEVAATVSSRATIRGLLRINGPFSPIGEPSIKTGSYSLVDLAGSVGPLGRGWSLDWEIQNLFSTRYPEVRASGYLNPGAPRAVRLAARFH